MNGFEVSFNSPQCGFMSIGLSGPDGEFHTTTANRPHASALSDLMRILSEYLEGAEGDRLLKWNRDPEEFDFAFLRDGGDLEIQIFEYPTGDRSAGDGHVVFQHRGPLGEVCSAFLATFRQLYEDRETDEFEFNWRQPFPETAFRTLESNLRN
jgi:hypothetical protein